MLGVCLSQQAKNGMERLSYRLFHAGSQVKTGMAKGNSLTGKCGGKQNKQVLFAAQRDRKSVV